MAERERITIRLEPKIGKLVNEALAKTNGNKTELFHKALEQYLEKSA